MELIETLKEQYTSTGMECALFDSKMKLLWHNTALQPEQLFLYCFNYLNKDYPSLPVTKPTVLRHDSGKAVLLRPIYENGEITGYAIEFFPEELIASLLTHSPADSLFVSSGEMMRVHLSEMMMARDEFMLRNTDREMMARLSAENMTGVCRVLSSTVNLLELRHYYCDEDNGSFTGISTRLLDTLAWTEELFLRNDCVVQKHIQPGVYARLNYERLEAVLLNLMINGYMYNPSEKKMLSVELKGDEDYLLLSVADNGSGADIQRLKAAAAGRLDPSEELSGEGLGLRLAQLFADKYDGDLAFSFSEAGGLAVSIELYRIKERAPLRVEVSPNPKIYTPYCPQQCILAKGLQKV